MENNELLSALMNRYFDFASDCVECKVQHIALYMLILRHNGGSAAKNKLVLSTADSMQTLKIGNRNTYSNALADLEKWEFVRILQHGKNQFQPYVIELCLFKSEQALNRQSASSELALYKQSTGNDQAVNEHRTDIEPALNRQSASSEQSVNEQNFGVSKTPDNQHKSPFPRAAKELNNNYLNINNSRELAEELEKEKIKKKEKEIQQKFEAFYEAYGKKVDKLRALKIWQGLTEADRKFALADAAEYNRRHPDKQFQKSPAVYLRWKNWEDEKPSQQQQDNSRWPNGLKKIIV
ncbi:hypothetical protein [Dyadobacter sp. BHUBP1]|uniref:hypothetical protein n=1 Tax=Dyadobacter sp. BHUBP1 TaxID=3424178 RepID=UPI003D3454CB